MKSDGVAINDNRVYKAWEKQVVSAEPNCKFISSIQNLEYKRQLLWFLWYITKTQESDERRLYFFWLCLWQDFFEDIMMGKVDPDPIINSDIEVATKGIVEFMDYLGIDDLEECVLGKLPINENTKTTALPM